MTAIIKRPGNRYTYSENTLKAFQEIDIRIYRAGLAAGRNLHDRQ